ncbi:MAG: small basic protein [Planctomycetota bacterium]|nr:small basic protein [Planctomycetota bacterium]
MSLDRSLKTASSLSRHRNVLTRAERVAKLTEKGGFKPSETDPLHLPKVGNRKVAAGGKTAKKEAAGDAAAPAAAPAKGAAPAAKGAAPAAKGAAPAAKAAPAGKK